MKLVTKTLEKRFTEVGSQANVDDPILITTFFNPVGPGTWYAAEYYTDKKVIFCYASIFGDWNDEWSYTSIDELESYKGAFGLGIERDVYWEEKPFSEVMQAKATKQ